MIVCTIYLQTCTGWRATRSARTRRTRCTATSRRRCSRTTSRPRRCRSTRSCSGPPARRPPCRRRPPRRTPRSAPHTTQSAATRHACQVSPARHATSATCRRRLSLSAPWCVTHAQCRCREHIVRLDAPRVSRASIACLSSSPFHTTQTAATSGVPAQRQCTVQGLVRGLTSRRLVYCEIILFATRTARSPKDKSTTRTFRSNGQYSASATTRTTRAFLLVTGKSGLC